MRLTAALIILAAVTAAPSPAAASADLALRLGDFRSRSMPDSVEIVVAEHLPEALAAGDSASTRLLLLERGKTRVAYGRAGDGEPDLREALARATACGDSAACRDALRYLAEACQQQGRRDEAAALLVDLERRARTAGDDFHTGKALYGLGRLRYRARDLAGADSLYTAALPPLLAAADSADLAALHNGLGNCRAGRGAYRDAAKFYAQAAVMARAGESRSLEAMATNNLAGIEMILGDPGAAVAGYRRARDIQRELGLWQQVGAPWRNLAQALTEQGRHDEARAELEAALVFCRERGFRDQETFTLVRLAEVDLAAGQPAAALGRCREVLGLSELPLDTSGNARLRAAEALLALGRGRAALAELDSAAALLHGGEDFMLEMRLAADRAQVQRSLGDHEAALAAVWPALARSAAAGVARYRLPLLVGAASSWFALGELDSARASLDSAERLWERERTLPADPEWRERRGAEAQQLFATRVALDLAEQDIGSAFAAAQRYKARTLLERILGPGAELPVPGDVPDPVTLDRLRRDVLKPGEVLLDLLAGPDHGWMFVVSRDTCLVRQLPAENAWESRLAPLLAQIEQPFAAYDERPAAAVAEVLLGPPAQEPAVLVNAAVTVFISPDGVLHQAPFSVLLPNGDLRRLPSATVLAHLRGQEFRGRGATRILAIAGRENAAHRRLAGAAAEVQRLGRRYRHVTVPAAGSADTAIFGGADPALYDLLHLACHGEADPQRPWNSALIFGAADQPVSLRAADVARLELTARLAVLSSCESAAGGILAGEGVLGLASGFLGAGVPAVVATLWPVDDGATARFVELFYGALEKGRPPALALTDARDALRAEPATAHPFFWAGFVLVGEGGSPVPLQMRRWWLPWLAGAAIPIGALAGAGSRRRLGAAWERRLPDGNKNDKLHK